VCMQVLLTLLAVQIHIWHGGRRDVRGLENYRPHFKHC
jgi:hypothetical protein